jgi:3-oxoacyl-[acyl-carrier protein] reductase
VSIPAGSTDAAAV